MYPDLSYLFHDLFGTEPDNWLAIFKTFGLMLVIAILTASWLLYLELKRKAEEGVFRPEVVKEMVGAPATPAELLSNALFGFVLGWKLPYMISHMAEMQADAAKVVFSLKGNWGIGLAAALLFAAMRWWERERQKLPKPRLVKRKVWPHDRIGDITIVAAVTGLIGSKVFTVIEDIPAFLADPLGQFFSGAGLTMYGSLVGGFLGVVWYLRKHEIPFWHFADAVAPALMIAYGVGRIGCQLAGDGDWGIVAGPQPEWWFLPDWMWAFDYPHNVNNEGVPIEGCTWRYCHRLPQPVYPTPIYETIAALLIGGLLWAWRKRFSVPGTLFFIYLILNGIERFLIETIRVNKKYEIWGMHPSQAQIIAVLLVVGGLAGLAYLYRKRATAPS